jgi:hypothetical protein
MHQGHHGANHPVKDHTTGKVEITSMNHGFAVDADSLPANVEETHVSLFDGSNCGIHEGQAGLLRAVPSRGLSGTARQSLPVQAFHRTDGRGQSRMNAAGQRTALGSVRIPEYEKPRRTHARRGLNV